MRALLHAMNRRSRKQAFKRQQRVDFYRAMYMYHRAGVRKLVALQKLYDTYSTYLSIPQRIGNRLYALLGGKRPLFRPVVAAVAETALIHRNLPLAQAWQDWLPSAELAIIDAGEASGDLGGAFDMAGRFARRQGGMWLQVATACTYPVIMTGLILAMLHFVGGTFLPGIEVQGVAQFSLSTQILIGLANLVHAYWYIGALALLLAVVMIVISLGTWKGRWRIIADRYPPWSIYRRVHGALFLYTYAVLQKSGTPILAALSNVMTNANPWLRTRIAAATLGVRQGHSIGRALRDAGHEFPDRQALPVLESIGGLSGASEALIEYAENWLEDTAIQIQRFSRRFSGISMVWVAAWILWLALGIIEIIFISFK